MPRRNGNLRLRDDYKEVTTETLMDFYFFPCMDDVIDDLWKVRYASKLNFLHGYLHMSLKE